VLEQAGVIFMVFLGIQVDKNTAKQKKDCKIEIPKDENICSVDMQHRVMIFKIDIKKE
jgi:hypothetical protein